VSELSAPAEYPNEYLGLSAGTNPNGPGQAVNKMTAPLMLATNNGATPAAILNSNSGVPIIGGNVGDLYFRVETPTVSNQRIYICTVAGTAGNATWVGIV
jgi:hypothetical protein